MSETGMNPAKKPLPGGVVLVLGLMCVAGAMAFGVSAPEAGAAPSPLPWQTGAGGLGLLALWASLAAGLGTPSRARTLALAGLSLLAALCWLKLPPALGEAAGGPGFWLGVLGLGALAVVSIQRAAVLQGRWGDAGLAAVLFGAWLLVFWQLLTQALDVPRVLLPAPSFIAASMVEHAATLWGDFVQTVGKAVVVGWVLGCGLGFGVAIAIDRAPFLQRGLLPLASLTSTVPLVGVAPIAVMWFGFDWPSKAAVVVLMTFFPMLVSTLAGLKAADTLQRELMHTYAATYLQTLRDLRLPSAFPHVVGAMKVNATLALIGAIVAEFFGSPTAGLGFRISTEAARMNMPLVWGAIAVAAVTGSVGYALLVKLERRVAFWHPSVRSAG
jgi:NitT/TauT family transport system permease protein